MRFIAKHRTKEGQKILKGDYAKQDLAMQRPINSGIQSFNHQRRYEQKKTSAHKYAELCPGQESLGIGYFVCICF